MNQGGKFILTKSKLFLYSCVFFIVGIATASFLPKDYLENDLYWFIGAAIIFIIAFFSWPKRKFGLAAILALFFILGIWRYAISLVSCTPEQISFYNRQALTVIGIIADDPDIREANVKYELDVEAMRASPATPVSGKILITTNLYPRYNYGDELEITGELIAPEPFNGFAYDRYLARYGIHSLCYYPKITRLGSGKGNRLYAGIFSVKARAGGLINRGLSEPEASLGRAMALGDKRSLSEDLRTAFSRSGLSHIAAISGMHISILSALAMSFLIALGVMRQRAFYLAAMLLALYILLIGLPASAMRAGLMGFLVLLALSIGRLNRLVNSLVLAAALILLFNPSLLRDDVGFQLSFLAVLGITFGYPWFERLSKSLKVPKAVRDIIAITLAAQVFTLPVIALNFSQVSLIAPLANLLVLWTLPLVMVSLLAGLALSALIPGLSGIWFLPSLVLLKYIIAAAKIMSRLPYSYLTIDYLAWGWALLYYILLIWLLFMLKRRELKYIGS